jgi:hypothetical protein
MSNAAIITRQQVQEDQRINHTAEVFGIHFPLRLEPYVYTFTKAISHDYNGGYWEFYALSNGGFYMAPNSACLFHVACENGFEGDLSADALGITACLYAYSHLSFTSSNEFAETCARQYHMLRDYMMEHPEVQVILGAID